MTKIGEGKSPHPEPSVQEYQRQLDVNTHKFLSALNNYESADAKEKAHLKSVMDQALGLIRSAVSELKATGMHKHEQKVEKDYQKFLAKDSSENLSALEQDVSTLREYSQEG